MVRDKGPRKTGGLGFQENRPQTFKKLIPVGIAPEYLPSFYPPTIMWCKAPTASIRDFRGMA